MAAVRGCWTRPHLAYVIKPSDLPKGGRSQTTCTLRRQPSHPSTTYMAHSPCACVHSLRCACGCSNPASLTLSTLHPRPPPSTNPREDRPSGGHMRKRRVCPTLAFSLVAFPQPSHSALEALGYCLLACKTIILLHNLGFLLTLECGCPAVWLTLPLRTSGGSCFSKTPTTPPL